MNEAKEKISAIVQAFAQEMYAQASAEGDPATQSGDTGQPNATKAEGDTVDADFEVVDEEEEKQ